MTRHEHTESNFIPLVEAVAVFGLLYTLGYLFWCLTP